MIIFDIRNLKMNLIEKDNAVFLLYCNDEYKYIYPLDKDPDIPNFHNKTLTFVLYFKNKKWKVDRTRITIWPFFHDPFTKREARLIVKNTKKYFNENYSSYDELILYEKVKEI